MLLTPKISSVIKHIKLVPRDTAVSWGSKGILMDMMATGEMEPYAKTRAKGQAKEEQWFRAHATTAASSDANCSTASRCDTSDPPKVKTQGRDGSKQRVQQRDSEEWADGNQAAGRELDGSAAGV